MTNDKSKIYFLLRMALPILVLIGHAAIIYTPDGIVSPTAGSTIIGALGRFIYAFHMPLFFALSGALWGYQIQRGKYRETGKFIKNKAKRLLIPYLFFGICIVAPVMTAFDFTTQNFGQYLLHGILLSGNSRHLWYVLALFWVFVLTILMRPVINRVHPLPILIVSLGVLYASQFIPYSVLQLQAALYYQFFFLLGYAIDRYFDHLLVIFRKVPWLSFVAFATILLRFVLPYTTITLLFYNFCGIFAAFGIACLFDAAKIQTSCFARMLERDGFGMYLFHPMLLYVIFYYLGPTGLTPWVLFPASIVVAGAVSIALTRLVRRLRLGVLIGE